MEYAASSSYGRGMSRSTACVRCAHVLTTVVLLQPIGSSCILGTVGAMIAPLQHPVLGILGQNTQTVWA